MILYRGFEFLLLDPDIALCHGGAAVLQELLHQGDVIAVGFVDLGGEELPKAVGADALEAEEVADQLQVLLNLALGEREKRLVLPDAVVLAVDPDPLIQGEWNGGKLGLEDGLILPTGMMTNRNPKSEHFNQDQKLDSWHLLSGTITEAVWGKLTFNDETLEKAFIILTVQTYLGGLPLILSPEMIREEDWHLLKPGNIVSAVTYLSGDVAINDYENGKVLDEENDLSLLRYSMTIGDPKRLKSALADDAVYHAETVDESYEGPDAIIERIQYVKEHGSIQYHIRKGTITNTEDFGEEKPTYAVGSRCLILYDKESDDAVALCFIVTDDDGRIRKIHTTSDSLYRFTPDSPPELNMPGEE